MARFTLPRDVYHGKGSLEALKTFKGKKAMICVGGGSMKRFGFLDKAEGYLKEAGMEVKIFDGIEPDPSVETVMRGAQAMAEFGPDWIVAIGGGSPIDAAKAMWIKYEYPECTFEDMCKVFGIPELRKKAHFCAVSSTSGTARSNRFCLPRFRGKVKRSQDNPLMKELYEGLLNGREHELLHVEYKQ